MIYKNNNSLSKKHFPTIFGSKMIALESCTSTNDYLKHLVAKSTPQEGLTIIADKQTEGKGQFGNIWQSKPYKNITLSTIVYPRFLSINEQFLLSKMVSVAIVECLNALSNLSFNIKWPNDIFYNNKKIGGILIENSIQQHTIQSSIIGIGINVNQKTFPNLPNASSLYNIVKYLFNLKKVIEILFLNLNKQYFNLTNHKKKNLDTLYCSYLKGYKKEVLFKYKNKLMNGTILGVHQDGKIEILENSEHKFFNFKEISFLH